VKLLPERGDLVFAGELLGWPAVRLGGVMLAGEEGWRKALTGPRPLTPIGRAQMLVALRRPLLMLTATGRRRLRTWLDAQRGAPIAIETPAARAARIADRLPYFGDSGLLSLVVSTVASLPRPVGDHVIEKCMVIIAGHSTNGWTSGRLPARLPIVIAGHRAPEEIAQTLRHEIGHRWLLDHHSAGEAPTRLFVKFLANGERQADLLAWSWAA
jgi:hypothetical protein